MPPLRLNLPLRPPAGYIPGGIDAEGVGGTANNNNNLDNTNTPDRLLNNEYSAGLGRSAATVGVGTVGMGTPVSVEGGGTGPWSTWPLLVMNTVHSTLKKWFTNMDAALLTLPGGVGPVLSAMVRLASLMLIASLFVRTSSNLMKLPSMASKAVVDPPSYTPGKHHWVAAPSRWDPQTCGICNNAIAWVSDAGVKCSTCGSHAHVGCSKRAHKEGLACKSLCRADVEASHRRLYFPLEEDQEEDFCVVEPELEKKPAPVMRHQWIRGGIDGLQSCAHCGGSCAGGGATGLHGFTCAWCKLQVHDGCIGRAIESECTLGRHRRLILPPIAVLKDQQPRKKAGLIREAVSKVRSVLPGNRDDLNVEWDPPPCVPPGFVGVDDLAASGGGGSSASNTNSNSQAQRFVETVREAAVAAASDVGLEVNLEAAAEGGRRLAEAVREVMPTGVALDIAVAQESGRRLRKAVTDAMRTNAAGRDAVWEEALGGATAKMVAEAAAGAAAESAAVAAVAAAAAAAVTIVETDNIAAGVAAAGKKSDEEKSNVGVEMVPSTVTPSADVTAAAYAYDVTDDRGDNDGQTNAGYAVREEDVTTSATFDDVTGGGVTADNVTGISTPSSDVIASVTNAPGTWPRLDGIPPAATTITTTSTTTSTPPPLHSLDQQQRQQPEAVDNNVVSRDTKTAGVRIEPAESVDSNMVSPDTNTVVGVEPEPVDNDMLPRNTNAAGEGAEGETFVLETEAAVGGREGVRVDGVDDGRQGGFEDSEGGRQQGELEDEEEDEEEEHEWVVKMQELYAKFQTIGDGPEATKTVSYSRKTRSVTLVISEDDIPDDSCPLVVFVNSKSGGKQGGVLISRFRALLNPLQVFDLSQDDPLEVLQRFRNVPNLRLLACGGDGTVAWLLETVDKISWKVKRPPLAVLPLGTGNDLARVLGWGGGYGGEGLETLLDAIENAQVTMLDRWSVSVVNTGKGSFLKTQKDRQLIMNNYLGIGVDGQVALDFHQMREARPVLFFNRAVNKVLYAQMGARSALVRACHDLSSRLEIRCDGRVVSLPETTASIIAVNINSYGGGSKLWALENNQDRNRRSSLASKAHGNPLKYRQRETVWGFDTSNLENPGGPVFAAAAAAAAASATAGSNFVADQGIPGGTDSRREEEEGNGVKAGGPALRLRAGNGRREGRRNGPGSSWGRAGKGGVGDRERAVLAGQRPPLTSAIGTGMDTFPNNNNNNNGVMIATGDDGSEDSSSASGGESSWRSDVGGSEEGEGAREGGVPFVRPEAKTSFHDGVMEVVAVEGVLHLGQIQLGLSRALALAQCRELQIRTSGLLPMQVDGEPWKQAPAEITVKLHNQAAMLRPATPTERAVTSVLSDVSAAIHSAEQDLIINERQARTLLSRIRRNTRKP